MIQVADNLWAGNSTDERKAEVGSILNVAKDLVPTRGWAQGINYFHVGLVDGPGNPIESYYAAVMSLVSLAKLGGKVMVCCHGGKSISLAVAMMYLQITTEGSYEWDNLLQMVRERNDTDIPEPNKAHKLAFDRLNWTLLGEIVI